MNFYCSVSETREKFVLKFLKRGLEGEFALSGCADVFMIG